jgi:hypothetical protein
VAISKFLGSFAAGKRLRHPERGVARPRFKRCLARDQGLVALETAHGGGEIKNDT